MAAAVRQGAARGILSLRHGERSAAIHDCEFGLMDCRAALAVTGFSLAVSGFSLALTGFFVTGFF